MSDKKDEPARHFGIPRRLQNTDTFGRTVPGYRWI